VLTVQGMRGLDGLLTRKQTSWFACCEMGNCVPRRELMRRLRAWMNGSRAASGWHTRAISIHSFSFHWVAPLQWLIFLSFSLSADAPLSAVCFLYALGGNYTWNYAWAASSAALRQNSRTTYTAETFSLVSPPPPLPMWLLGHQRAHSQKQMKFLRRRTMSVFMLKYAIKIIHKDR